MDQLPAHGKNLPGVLLPTFKAYAPLLQSQASTIKSVKRETFAYGPHDRQQLDIYHAPQPAIVNGRRPVLLFEYGGGLTQGGAFFALNPGYMVVIADYRLMSHGAKFPSGGEDIALAVDWIDANQAKLGPEPIDLFIMGNSAGGIHLSTFLLHPDFAETRRKVSQGSGSRLRGAILLSVPFHFAHARDTRPPALEAYFGDFEKNSPLGLLKSARQRQETPLDFVKGGCRILALDAELDPENDIRRPGRDFIKEWLEIDDNASQSALAVDSMMGHNHISPVLGLGTGNGDEEAWGHQVASFCDTIRHFKPRDGC
ncbi:hypothetical protein LTR74_007706 [Friedmanniomyces endolithicus]|nr:hypothetical protein LTR74_007706 [Friedmanniomyces endolithicus]